VPATKPAHCFFSLTAAGPRPALLRLAPPALDLLSLASHFTFETSSCQKFRRVPFSTVVKVQVQFYFTLVERRTKNEATGIIILLLSTKHEHKKGTLLRV
jgi:hypothetical protein